MFIHYQKNELQKDSVITILGGLSVLSPKKIITLCYINVAFQKENYN
jgi:hypothetical protein